MALAVIAVDICTSITNESEADLMMSRKVFCKVFIWLKCVQLLQSRGVIELML